MLVLNLACPQGHLFEGWFGSAGDFESQQQRRLISCPVCGQQEISRLPSAPRLNVAKLKGDAALAAPRVEPAGEMAPEQQQLQRRLQQLALQAVRQLMANTEDVGERFAEEARRIHYGETEERGIRGRTSADEAQALAEEGIAVMPLPDLPGGDTLQ